MTSPWAVFERTTRCCESSCDVALPLDRPEPRCLIPPGKPASASFQYSQTQFESKKNQPLTHTPTTQVTAATHALEVTTGHSHRTEPTPQTRFRDLAEAPICGMGTLTRKPKYGTRHPSRLSQPKIITISCPLWFTTFNCHSHDSPVRLFSAAPPIPLDDRSTRTKLPTKPSFDSVTNRMNQIRDTRRTASSASPAPTR